MALGRQWVPATTFDFIRFTFLISQQISNSTFFAKMNSNSESNNSLSPYSTYYLPGAILNMFLYNN